MSASLLGRTVTSDWIRCGILRSFFLVCLILVLNGGCGRFAGQGSDGSARVPDHELFLLPRDYRGPVLAIYDQPHGQQPAWRGDTGIYGVPATGIVRVPHSEPPRATGVSVAFSHLPHTFLRYYQTCDVMRLHAPRDTVGYCSLDFWRGGTGVPDHVVIGVVTDWDGIPQNYNRTAFVYDSVLFDRRNPRSFQWEEPREPNPRPTSNTTLDRRSDRNRE